jgi:hypothetical protein
MSRWACLVFVVTLAATAGCQADDGSRPRDWTYQPPDPGYRERFVVRDAEGRRRYGVDERGVIRDNRGERRGSIDERGVLRDNEGRRVGNIERRER